MRFWPRHDTAHAKYENNPDPIHFSAARWGVAFAIFCVAYYPILSRLRLGGQPG